MPLLSDYDIQRIRMVLDDLERTTWISKTGPMMRLEAVVDDYPEDVVLRGVATRLGALRLGLQIARDALDRDCLSIIDQDSVQFMEIDSSKLHVHPGLIEIFLTDDPLLPPPRHEQAGPVSRFLLTCFFASLSLLIVGPFLVGLGTIIAFLVGLVSSWLSG